VKSSTLVFELRALADRLAPQSNFNSCLALIGADTLERVRALQVKWADWDDPTLASELLAALEGKP
jgi:hypothetical protein